MLDGKKTNGPGATLHRRQFIAGATAAGALLAAPRAHAARGIVVYSTTLPPIQAELTQAFTAKTGIPVQSLRLTTSPLAQRFLAEQESGQALCDVITLGHNEFFQDIAARGLLAPIDDIPGVSGLQGEWRPHDLYTMIMFAPNSIAYNTNLVASGSEPAGWEDVLRPEFRGEIIFADPRANETILQIIATLHDTYGDDYLRALSRQNMRYVPSIPQGIEQVMAGEAKLMVPCLAMNLIQYQGTDAPIRLIPTPSPTSGTFFFSGVVSSAPNPDGARAWYEYVLSEEGQEILCRGNGVSALGQIPGSLLPPTSFLTHDMRELAERAHFYYDLLDLSA